MATTKRDKPIIAHQGYMYRFDKRSADEGKFWRCLKDGCAGRIKTDSADVFIEYRNAAHCHSAAPEETAVRQIMTTMKHRAQTESGSVAQVYREETVWLKNQPTVAAAMPTSQEVKLLFRSHNVQKWMSKANCSFSYIGL